MSINRDVKMVIFSRLTCTGHNAVSCRELQ